MSCRCCCIGRCCWQLHPAEDNINKVIIGISHWPRGVVELGEWWQICPSIEVATGKHTVSGLGQVANREQATHGCELSPIENIEVRWGHNHDQWKRKIAAGHVRVWDYISSRILAKGGCSQALPTPDVPFVCVNSLGLLSCSTQVSSSRIKI